MPNDLSDLFAQRGQGQAGVFYADQNGPRGQGWSSASILYDNCWNHGLYALGKTKSVEYAFGVTTGAPSSPVRGSDTNQDISLHGKVGIAPTEWSSVHVSYARGAYLWDDVTPYLPAGNSVNDYQQELWILSGQVSGGRFVGHGEFFWNHFDSPLHPDGLGSTSYYVEGTAKLWPGTYAALRFDEMRFASLSDGTQTMTWDQNVRRAEFGFGYSVSRDLRLKAVVQMFDLGDGFSSDNSLPVMQASLRF